MSEWQRALVTGASSGIGEGFAAELAARNVDLILVGRDLAALEAVAGRARFEGVRTEVLQADLSTDGGVARVVSCLLDARPHVDLLVNNAGVGQWGWFVDLPIDGAIETVRVNDEAVVRLTHAALPRMLAAGSGTIIQVASMASAAPGPQQAVYAASKAFVSSFGQALSAELAATPVTCTTVLPGFTRTRYFERVGLSVDMTEKRWMSAGEVARLSLDAANRGIPLVIPGPKNRLKVEIATQFPSLTVGRVKRAARRAVAAAQRTKGRVAGAIPPRGWQTPSERES